MNWIIYFTNYGNCKKVADLIEKGEKSAKREVKIENGEVATPKEVLGDSPAVIHFGAPIHHHQLSKKASKWLDRLVKEIKARSDAAAKPSGDVGADPGKGTPWMPKVAIFYTHRFPEDDFKIDVGIKKFLRKAVISKKSVKDGKETKGMALMDIVHVPFLGVLVSKVTGPLEAGANTKVEAWIDDSKAAFKTSPPQQPIDEEKGKK